jgi:hypothetical protein
MPSRDESPIGCTMVRGKYFQEGEKGCPAREKLLHSLVQERAEQLRNRPLGKSPFVHEQPLLAAVGREFPNLFSGGGVMCKEVLCGEVQVSWSLHRAHTVAC